MALKLNHKLLKQTMNQIIEHPETWEQDTWHCGTTHCFAGWAELIHYYGGQNLDPDDYYPNRGITSHRAREALGIGKVVADELFHSDNNLHDLHAMVKALLKGNIANNTTSTKKIRALRIPKKIR